MPVAPNSAEANSDEAWKAWKKVYELDAQKSDNIFSKIIIGSRNLVDVPVTWFRESVVNPRREKYRMPYYHRQFKRPPPVEECAIDDRVCLWEANFQFRLDKQVDANILMILRARMDDCLGMCGIDSAYKCAHLQEEFEEADLNYFIKYGEMGFAHDVSDAFMKQKHRMIWERRHPEVMAQRRKELAGHKAEVAGGHFNYLFWRSNLWFQDRDQLQSITGRGVPHQVVERSEPIEITPLNTRRIWFDPDVVKDRKRRAEWDAAHGVESTQQAVDDAAE